MDISVGGSSIWAIDPKSNIWADGKKQDGAAVQVNTTHVAFVGRKTNRIIMDKILTPTCVVNNTTSYSVPVRIFIVVYCSSQNY